jgi:hypothetical protein
VRLHPPKCLDEVCRSHATTRTQGGDGNKVRNFEFGANLPLADSFVIWMNLSYRREAASNSLAGDDDMTSIPRNRILASGSNKSPGQ